MTMQRRISKRPLYLQVRDALARRIAEGEWRPGTTLPSEDQLARELDISMGTVRKALDSMEEEKLIRRRQGHGTVVVDQLSEEVAGRFYNISDAAEHPLRGDVEVLCQTKCPANATERERLELADSELVLRTERLRRHKRRPFLLEEASLALCRFPGLDGGNVGSYHLPALAQRCGVHLGLARERVKVVAADTPAADRLAIAAGTPLLRLDRVVFAEDGLPVEWRVGLCYLPQSAAYSVRMK